MTSLQPAAEPASQKAPVSLEQVAAFLDSVDDGELTFELALRSDALKIVHVPDRSFLRVETAFTDAVIDCEKTHVSVVDEFGKKVYLRGLGFCFSFSGMELEEIKPVPETGRSANLLAVARLMFFRTRRVVMSDLPLNLSALLEKLAGMTVSKPTPEEEDPASEATSTTVPADDKSLFNGKEIRYDLKFSLPAGATLELNEGTSVTVTTEGMATVHVEGVRDYTKATVTGSGLILKTAMLETKPSDIDVRVTLNRKPKGMHHIAFNPSTLRGVQFKSSDFEAPPIETLRIVAKEYDFVITINPHDKFTVQMLIAKITARVGNPDLVAKLRKKMMAKAEDVSAGPSEIVVDSARWNIVDYVTHDFKDVFADVKDLPHIREHLDDPAIQKVAREGVPHLQAFVVSTRLQLASSYDRVNLKAFVELALSQRVCDNLIRADSNAVRKLLTTIGLSDAEVNSFLDSPKSTSGFEDKLDIIATGSDQDFARNVTRSLHDLGNILNSRERTWLRRVWVDAGGLESEGRGYALLANFVEALAVGISADPDAPPGLKELLKKVPLGEDLVKKIAVASDNVRGAIWAANGVLKHGWLAVSRDLEKSIQRIFGEDITGRGVDVFRESAKKSEEESFLPGNVRFLGNGEEFFQQIMQLLDETDRVFAENEEVTGTIVLNYWSFEAVEALDGSDEGPNVWGVTIAHRLKDLAVKGFTVSIVVDEKNGPSRGGQVLLRNIAADVQESGKGVFQLHPWVPHADNFPTGTHVKYFCTPLGVIAGGSNLGDHYAHWSDVNILIRGAEVVQCFASHHFAILEQQRSLGYSIANIPSVEPVDMKAWNPLAVYKHHDHDTKVFDPDWQDVELRVFRDQGGDAKDRILVECIAALDSARGISANGEEGALPAQTVYIANCYFIVTQPVSDHPLSRALQRALERGVNVEILSNTKDSIDVPVTASPIVKSMYLILAIARNLTKTTTAEGRKTGRVTLHLPDAEFVMKNKEKLPEVLIHDKILMVGELALVKTTNLHPRSFTLEQELLTEMIGTAEPPRGDEHDKFMAMARLHVEELQKSPGGSRIKDIDAVLAPVNWHGETPPEMWGPGASLYLLFVDKRYRYCHSFSSDSDDDVKQVEAKLDESTSASLTDLMMNIF